MLGRRTFDNYNRCVGRLDWQAFWSKFGKIWQEGLTRYFNWYMDFSLVQGSPVAGSNGWYRHHFK